MQALPHDLLPLGHLPMQSSARKHSASVMQAAYSSLHWVTWHLVHAFDILQSPAAPHTPKTHAS